MDAPTSDRPYELQPLIERIRRMEEAGQEWSLPADEVRALLGVDSVAFYRSVYSAHAAGHPLVGLSSAMERFSQENIWDFVALVELFSGPQAVSGLERAGIFFSLPEQVEIMAAFLQAGTESVRRHRLQEEEFSAMLRAFRAYGKAREVYLEEYFPLERRLEETVRAYCAGRSFGLPELARRNVLRLLRFFIRKKVLDPLGAFAPLEDLLFGQAVREGCAEAPSGRCRRTGEAAGRSGREAAPPASPAAQQARRAMELPGQPLTPGLLKERYRSLMKRYHPDLNPAGLRRCQEINAAYELLLSTL